VNEYVACINIYKILVAKPSIYFLFQEVLQFLGRSRQRWEYNIRMDCKERGLNGMQWFHMAQDRVKMARLL
jgi:hypothetical protein